MSFKRIIGRATSLLLVCLVACLPGVPELGIQVHLVKRKLPNGLTVVMTEDHSVPMISYQTWFRVGSVDEYPGITGITHMFEHLMFKGTPKYGPREFFRELESRGAEINAYTTRDYTVFYESISPNLIPKVIDMESDRMANLTLNDDLLNTERMVVMEERRLRADNTPDGKMQEALWQLAYRRHPYQWPVIGFPMDILRISTQQLIEYFKKYFQPANATIIVAGDFNTEQLFEQIKKSYENIPSQPKPVREVPLEPEQEEERRLTIRDKIVSERFTRAYHITSAEGEDTYPLDVLSNILFEGNNSRAYRRLVEEKDLVAAISGSSYTPAYPGLFIVSATLKAKVPSALAEAELDRVIEKLQENGVTEKEVQIAVKQLTVQFVDSVRTPYGIAQMIGTVESVFADPRNFTEDLVKYSRVTPEDVRRVALKYLQPNNRSVVNLLPSSKP